MILAGSRETQQYFHSIYLLLTYTKYTIIYLLHLDYTGMSYTHKYKQNINTYTEYSEIWQKSELVSGAGSDRRSTGGSNEPEVL